MRSFRPGEFPPTFLPYCRVCDLPVARIQYRIPKAESWTVDFDGQCCGKTMGRRMTMAEMYRLQQTNEKFYLIVRKAETQNARAQARR